MRERVRLRLKGERSTLGRRRLGSNLTNLASLCSLIPAPRLPFSSQMLPHSRQRPPRAPPPPPGSVFEAFEPAPSSPRKVVAAALGSRTPNLPISRIPVSLKTKHRGSCRRRTGVSLPKHAGSRGSGLDGRVFEMLSRGDREVFACPPTGSQARPKRAMEEMGENCTSVASVPCRLEGGLARRGVEDGCARQQTKEPRLSGSGGKGKR